MSLPTLLVSFHETDPNAPFFRDPWMMERAIAEQRGVIVHFSEMTAEKNIPINAFSIAGPDVIGSALSALQWLEATIAANPRYAHGGFIYSVHPRSILCRLLGRWAELRGLEFPTLAASQLWNYQDLCELVNTPAILTAEERFEFSAARCARILNQPATTIADTLWMTARRFLA